MEHHSQHVSRGDQILNESVQCYLHANLKHLNYSNKVIYAQFAVAALSKA